MCRLVICMITKKKKKKKKKKKRSKKKYKKTECDLPTTLSPGSIPRSLIAAAYQATLVRNSWKVLCSIKLDPSPVIREVRIFTHPKILRLYSFF